jgi:hypothetical protein
MRPTVGKYLPPAPIPKFSPLGKAAFDLAYFRSQSSLTKSPIVCGAWRSGESSIVIKPSAISVISE